MLIEKADPRFFPEISELILKEFPYTQASEEKLRERLSTGKFFLFTLTDSNQLIGFIELELLSPVLIRVNGLVVKKEFRGKGNAGKLIDFAVSFAKEKGFEEILLWVSQKNSEAKKIYESKGFSFHRLLDKKLAGQTVEEMKLILKEKEFRGVS